MNNYTDRTNVMPARALAGLVKLGFYLVALLLTTVAAPGAATWNGGSTTSSLWSDTANWTGGAGPSTNGPSTTTNALVFSGTTRLSNTNDLSGLSIGPITMSTAGWNIQGTGGGTNVTLQSGGGAWTASVSGTSTVGLNLFLNTGASFTQSATADNLYLTGVISGTATGNGIGKVAGSGGQGYLYLVNTNNSFIGQVNIRAGALVAYSLAPAGTNSSLGAATGAQAPILIGVASSGYGGRLIYAGTNNCLTDRQLQFANNTTGGTAGFPTGFYNNSPNNSSVTFAQDAADDIFTFADGTANVFPLVLIGTSSGTTTFMPQLGTGNPPYWGGSMYLGGPGTWAFSNLVIMTGSVIVSNTATFQLLYNDQFSSYSELPVLSQITIKPGGLFDVSSYDQNSSVFALGSLSGYPQVLTAGRTNSQAPAIDLNGSLSLTGPAGATLNVSGTGVPGTLTISSNFIPGSGTIKLDLGTNTTAGQGSNDLIVVNGNLDLSQGNAVVSVNPLNGALAAGVPYTLIAYSGSLIGDVSGLSVPAPSRSYNPGVVTASGGLIQVTFNPSGQTNATLVWQGSAGPNWDVQTTANWLNGSSSDYFLQGDLVAFNDSASQFNVNVVGTPAPGGILVSNSANSYVMSSDSSGAIGGTGVLTKQGTNELTLDLAGSYTGGTVISAGTVSGGNNTALGSGTITLGDGNTGANTVSLLLNGGASIGNAITVSSSVTNTVTIGYESGAAVTYNGVITMQRGMTLYTTNALVTSSLFIYGGIAGTGDVTISGGGSVKWQTASCVFTGNLYILGDNPNTATYLGVNTALSPNCNVYVASNAVFGDVSSPTINALTGGGLVEPGFNATYTAPMNIGEANGSGTFTGSFTTNNNGFSCLIQKYGTGTETLTGDNSLSAGATIVQAGTLAVNNTTGYGLGLGGVTVNASGTLAGTGTIFATNNNPIVISGTLSVGNAGDTTGKSFTFTNTAGLTINSSGALNVDLFSGAGAGDNTGNAAAADVLNAQCPVTLNSGAILNVSNPDNLTAWAVGDKWKIANWSANPVGTFTVLNLPALPAGLAWDTTSLYTAGVIGIITSTGPTQPANILGVTLSGTSLVINGTNLNGGQNFHYAVLASTNLNLPLSSWTVLSTNAFNADGTFNYTNVASPTNAALFFDVKAVQ